MADRGGESRVEGDDDAKISSSPWPGQRRHTVCSGMSPAVHGQPRGCAAAPPASLQHTVQPVQSTGQPRSGNQPTENCQTIDKVGQLLGRGLASNDSRPLKCTTSKLLTCRVTNGGPYGPLFMLFRSQKIKQQKSVGVLIVCHFYAPQLY